MTAPVRIQLKRTKGWRMPANTVKVDRTTKWGNPFRVTQINGRWSCTTKRHPDDSGLVIWCQSPERASDLMWREYRSHLAGRRREVQELRGKNLACWCAPGAPCHADVLLELANRPDLTEAV